MADSPFVVVDYGMGNIRSIRNGLEVVGERPEVVSDPADLGNPKAIVVPGVGAFQSGMANLERQGFVEPLEALVISEGVPYLGLCLGMQFLAETSYEHGTYTGFGWLPAEVVRIEPAGEDFRVPHMGWSETHFRDREQSVIFRGFDRMEAFYYVHSYHLNVTRDEDEFVIATSWHGMDVTAAVRKRNVFGVQFHPEKSQGAGLRVLENFAEFAKRGDGP